MQIIDGAYGEGGGQIVRTALALAAFSGQKFEVHSVRSGRRKPGLKAQHLQAVRALIELGHGECRGDDLGSQDLYFSPGSIQGRTLSVDIGTAGSISLLLQSLLLPCCFSDDKTRLKIVGGTDVKWSPSFDYFLQLVLPHYLPFADIKAKLHRRGFYPAGGGKVEVTIRPKYHLSEFSTSAQLIAKLHEELGPLLLEKRGPLRQIRGVSCASNELRRQEVAERQIRGAKYLLQELGVPLRIDSAYVDSKSIGTIICLLATFENEQGESPILLGGAALGEKGKRAEIVGEEAAKQLMGEIDSGAPVDRHLADQLIPLIALRGGVLRASELTPHTMTNLHTVSKFLDLDVKTDGNIVRVA